MIILIISAAFIVASIFLEAAIADEQRKTRELLEELD